MSKKHEADVRCENGHTTTVWATLVAHDKETDRLTFIMGSSADFCNVCGGAVVQTLEVRPK